MVSYAVVGKGQIGWAIRELLLNTGENVSSFDLNPQNSNVVKLDVHSDDAIKEVVSSHDVVFSAIPWDATEKVAKQVIEQGNKIYLDLTEDLIVGRKIITNNDVASTGSTVVPHCGLAPGAVSLIAGNMMRCFTTTMSIKIRVGALPQAASNRLGYFRTWSTSGLVNEYLKRGERIRDGHYEFCSSLDDVDNVVLQGMKYEAFNTSGGAGTLIDSCKNGLTSFSTKGSVDYKTLRYPGHCELMKFLFEDMKLKHDPEALAKMLDWAIPTTRDDVVVIWIEVTGTRDNRVEVDHYVRHVYGDPYMTAIQKTTAGGIVAVAQWLAMKQLAMPKVQVNHISMLKPTYRMEDIPLNEVEDFDCWAPYR